MKIKIYTTTTCSHCEPYIQYVRELASSDTEIEVYHLDKLPEDYVASLNIRSVPYTEIWEDGRLVDKWFGSSKKIERYLL